MTNCDHIVALIKKNDDTSLKEGMTLLFLSEDLQKIGKYFYNRYPNLAFVSWEDLVTETIIRFVEAIQADRLPIKNCWGFARNICRNICEEYQRNQSKFDRLVHWIVERFNSPDNSVERSKIETVIAKLGKQCQILLWALFFEIPPITDKTELSNLLKAAGFDVAPGSVATLITRCKQSFRMQLSNDPSSLFRE
jgi:hypothetical protein